MLNKDVAKVVKKHHAVYVIMKGANELAKEKQQPKAVQLLNELRKTLGSSVQLFAKRGEDYEFLQ